MPPIEATPSPEAPSPTDHRQDGPRQDGPSLVDIGPFNLRLTVMPLRCVTGLAIAPGLVGFCWETPLSQEVLWRQAPDLAAIAALWPHPLRPIVEAGRTPRGQWLVGGR